MLLIFPIWNVQCNFATTLPLRHHQLAGVDECQRICVHQYSNLPPNDNKQTNEQTKQNQAITLANTQPHQKPAHATNIKLERQRERERVKAREIESVDRAWFGLKNVLNAFALEWMKTADWTINTIYHVLVHYTHDTLLAYMQKIYTLPWWFFFFDFSSSVCVYMRVCVCMNAYRYFASISIAFQAYWNVYFM